MGRVLSQGEIDSMLSNLLKDATVLPSDEPAAPVESAAPEVVPAGIAAFRAKLEASKAAKQAE